MRIIALVLATVMAAHAKLPTEGVPWNRTPEVLRGEFVQVKMADGTRIGGAWISVTPGTFIMSVEKTSNKREVRKGLHTLPRSSIVKVTARERRVRGRVIGIIAVFYSVMAIGAVVTGSMEAGQGPTGVIAFFGAIGGYFLGREFDHASREVILLPEDSNTTF